MEVSKDFLLIGQLEVGIGDGGVDHGDARGACETTLQISDLAMKIAMGLKQLLPSR